MDFEETLTLGLALASAYGKGGREGCGEILSTSDVDPEELVLTLVALAHELVTFAAAGYRESTQEILQIVGRSMTKAEPGA